MITEIPYTDACPHCGAELYSFPNHSDETYWRCGTRTSKCLKVCCRSSGCYKRELAASQAEVEGLKTVKDYWANLWADLSHAAISDNVRLEKRAEKAEAEVERITGRMKEAEDLIKGLHDGLKKARVAHLETCKNAQTEIDKLYTENVCLQELIQEFYEWSRRDYPTEQEVREIMNRYHHILNK